MMLGMPVPIFGKSRKPPFSLSGTFATDMDGWTGTLSRSATSPRTSPGSLNTSGSFGNYAEYVIPKAVCAGLTISASIWFRSQTTSITASLSYKIGTGSLITLATGPVSNSYVQQSGSFENPGNDDVLIRVDFDGRAFVDDWEISGL